MNNGNPNMVKAIFSQTNTTEDITGIDEAVAHLLDGWVIKHIDYQDITFTKDVWEVKLKFYIGSHSDSTDTHQIDVFKDGENQYRIFNTLNEAFDWIRTGYY